METELTKKMKRGLRAFRPDLPTKMRTIRFAEEVWTPTGIVDFIRFEDYKEKEHSFCGMINFENFDENYQNILKDIHPQHNLGSCKIEGETFPNKNCKGCFWIKRDYDIGMMITCYECKITVQDFKSNHGHNFHGNKNYYVVPKEIISEIKPLVPKEIGIISYNNNSNNYRIVKECEWKNIDDKTKIDLLYNAFKKWVDKFSYEY